MRNKAKGKSQAVEEGWKPGEKSYFCFGSLRAFLSCISLMAVFVTGSTANAAITAPSYTAVFVADPTRPIPTQEFDCSQNIYAYFTWWGLKDLHQITVLWINPKGKQQDEIDLKFVAAADKIENWVGLKFFNLRKERNPLIHDSSSADFVGTWAARIFLDGNLLEEKKFAVTCD